MGWGAKAADGAAGKLVDDGSVSMARRAARRRGTPEGATSWFDPIGAERGTTTGIVGNDAAEESREDDLRALLKTGTAAGPLSPYDSRRSDEIFGGTRGAFCWEDAQTGGGPAMAEEEGMPARSAPAREGGFCSRWHGGKLPGAARTMAPQTPPPGRQGRCSFGNNPPRNGLRPSPTGKNTTLNKLSSVFITGKGRRDGRAPKPPQSRVGRKREARFPA